MAKKNMIATALIWVLAIATPSVMSQGIEDMNPEIGISIGTTMGQNLLPMVGVSATIDWLPSIRGGMEATLVKSTKAVLPSVDFVFDYIIGNEKEGVYFEVGALAGFGSSSVVYYAHGSKRSGVRIFDEQVDFNPEIGLRVAWSYDIKRVKLQLFGEYRHHLQLIKYSHQIENVPEGAAVMWTEGHNTNLVVGLRCGYKF